MTARPTLLDLFCGAGGCTRGYELAGFRVVGVDVKPQPDYCGPEFVQADAVAMLADLLASGAVNRYDALHASPPCQHRTVARNGGVNPRPNPHPDLLTPVLRMLAPIEVPWVVENVPGPPLPAAYVVTLCGSMFGLRVRRHRLFASNRPLPQPSCSHKTQGPVVGVYGEGGADANRARRPGQGGGVKVHGAEAAAALGCDWTNRQAVLAQMIPPAYTEWIGRQLREWMT